MKILICRKSLIILFILFFQVFALLTLSNGRVVSTSQTEHSLFVEKLNVRLPFNLTSASYYSNGSHAFKFGGVLNSGWYASNHSCIIDLQTFSEITLLPDLPVPLFAADIISIGNKIYIFGGFDNGTTYDTIFCFNSKSLEYREIDSRLPKGLETVKVGIYEGSVYIFGGSNIEKGHNYEVFKFDPESDSITTIELDMPDYYINYKLAPCENGFNLIGGQYTNTNRYSDEIWHVNLETMLVSLTDYVLPFPMSIQRSYIFQNYLYSFVHVFQNGTRANSLWRINIDTLEYQSIAENYLPSNILYFDILRDDFSFYLIGVTPIGNVPIPYVYRLNLNPSILNNGFSLISDKMDWNISDPNIFDFNKGKSVYWKFNDSLNQMRRDHKLSVSKGDVYELEVRYDNHSDKNTRQAVFIGWADDPLSENATQQKPSSHFCGIKIKNTQFDGQNRLSLELLIMKDDYFLNRTSIILPANITHTLRYQVHFYNETHIHHTFTLNGNVQFNELFYTDYSNLAFHYFSIWNQKLSPVYGLQGSYNGSLSFARYSSNVSSLHTHFWIDYPLESELSEFDVFLNEIIPPLVIIFSLLIMSIIILIVSKPKLISEPDLNLPKFLMPSSLYILYKKLAKAFNRLQTIENSFIIDSDQESDTISSPISFNADFPVETFNFIGLSGVSLKILIYLLENIHLGTFASAIQTDLDMNKSSVAYSIKILEEKGLIKRLDPSPKDDMRYKIILITSDGKTLLYYIYKRLDEHFN